MADEDADETLEDVPPNLDEVLQSHRSRRQRIWQGALVALAVILALGVIVRPNLAAWLPSAFGGQALVVTSNVTGARVRVRGPQVQLTGQTPFNQTLPRRLSPYSFTITLDVAPFTEQACQLSVPRQATDSCVVAEQRNAHAPAGQVVVQFRLGLYDLVPEQARAAALAVFAFQQELQQQTLIPVGGHFGLVAPLGAQVATAATPLVAVLETLVAPGQATDCLTVCAGDPFVTVPQQSQPHQFAPPEWWAIRLNILRQWVVDDAASGQVVRTYPESQAPVVLNLIAAWDGAHWVISRQEAVRQGGALPFDSFGRPLTGICDDARLVFTNLIFQESLGDLDSHLTLGDHGVEGCVIRTKLTPLGQTVAVPVAFVWRFGQMFAADAQTLGLVSNFPLANAVDLVPFAGDLVG